MVSPHAFIALSYHHGIMQSIKGGAHRPTFLSGLGHGAASVVTWRVPEGRKIGVSVKEACER